MTTTPLHIAVLGIGMMGLPMARRLSEAGHQVRAWNRTRAKAEPWPPTASPCSIPRLKPYKAPTS